MGFGFWVLGLGFGVWGARQVAGEEIAARVDGEPACQVLWGLVLNIRSCRVLCLTSGLLGFSVRQVLKGFVFYVRSFGVHCKVMSL